MNTYADISKTKINFEDQPKKQSILIKPNDQNEINLMQKEATHNNDIDWFMEKFRRKNEGIKKRIANFKFSLWEKLSLDLGLKKAKQEKHKVFRFAEKEMAKLLEIDFIIDKFKDIEQIKNILFSKKQRKIFNLLQKYNETSFRTNHEAPEKKEMSLLDDEKEFVNGFRYLIGKRASGNPSNIDANLYRELEELLN